ncbi:hypothetical protein AB0L41_09770 [Amycolatopsis mediterranei]|uniref:hypothetical protein n=1 Tax=Amycolatopsis mediterranei TaxID=33910 RepID=UPI00341EFE53
MGAGQHRRGDHGAGDERTRGHEPGQLRAAREPAFRLAAVFGLLRLADRLGPRRQEPLWVAENLLEVVPVGVGDAVQDLGRDDVLDADGVR